MNEQLPEQILWEQAGSQDWLKSLVATVREILTNPKSFFQKVALGQDLKRPLWFAIIINTTMFVIGQAFNIGFGLSPARFGMDAEQMQWLGSFFSLAFLPFAIIFMALFVVATLFISAGVNHFCLYLLGAAHRNFEQSLRVVCYASAPYVLCFIPVLGGFLGWIWSFILTVIGLKTVHMTSTSRALLACLLPVIVCCGLFILLGVMIGATALGALMTSGR